jgi:hypothetical protein
MWEPHSDNPVSQDVALGRRSETATHLHLAFMHRKGYIELANFVRYSCCPLNHIEFATDSDHRACGQNGLRPKFICLLGVEMRDSDRLSLSLVVLVISSNDWVSQIRIEGCADPTPQTTPMNFFTSFGTTLGTTVVTPGVTIDVTTVVTTSYDNDYNKDL